MPTKNVKKNSKSTGKSSKWVKPSQTPTRSAPDIPPNVPTEKFPIDAPVLRTKKWFLKDALAFNPTIRKWYERGMGKDKVTVRMPVEEQSSYRIRRNTIVDTLPQDHSISWSAIAYEITAYDYTEKQWVTTRLTGWVDNANLDDYIEEFPDSEVTIKNKTKSSTDLEQDITIEDEDYAELSARYNMCGELSIAFVVKETFNAQSSIEDVLKKWKESEPKNKKGININYAKLVGKGMDKTLVANDLKGILDLYFTDDDNAKIQPYTPELPGQKIPLTNLGNDPYDDRHANPDFRDKLLEYYLITLVTINPNTGELILNPEASKRNHWVVVDKISHDGVRVEIYNPSPNKRQAYSFHEFSTSVGSNPNTGWWVKRKRHCIKDQSDKAPAPEVTIENPTPNKTDAEQYILVENLKKVNLCGEFSVAYILKSSLDRALQYWSKNQVALKMQAKDAADIRELATVIQAFAINPKKANIRSYSIDNILKYWKTMQPDLYGSILGGSNNETTGPTDLITILNAYGYEKNKGHYIFEGLSSSPGVNAEMLKSYYFIAGVKIDTGKKGRLKNKDGPGVDHWVVLTEINPVGTMVGGNGGWVKLYNPFMNVLEEYSYKEFMASYSGAGFKVIRNVEPTFDTWHARVPAKDTSKKPKGKSKAVVSKMPEANLRREIQKAKDKGTTSPDAIASMLSNPKLGFGWSKSEIFKLLKNPEVTSTRESLVEVERSLCENLEIDFIPREIAMWIRNISNGDSSFAGELSNILRDYEILMVEYNDGTEVKPDDPPLPKRDKRGQIAKGLKDENFLHTLQTSLASRFDASTPSSKLTRKIVDAFTEQAVEQLRKIPPIEVAYKSRLDYIEWEKGITESNPKIYRVRQWGDSVMKPLQFDTNRVGGNFQAVGLYNKETGFGAVSNYIHILRDDIDHLIDLQFDEIVNDQRITVEDKMGWLCQKLGKIYMFDDSKDSWQKSVQIRWGTLALGGNLVQVVGELPPFDVKLPGEKVPKKRKLLRLAGFKKSDWSRPLDELLAEGLVHRCFCANGDNSFADSPKGIVYSPFYDITQWNFNNGTEKPDGLYIPEDYLEPKN